METLFSQKPIYFLGCDMGGWQNTDDKKGDALAVCKWIDGQLQHVLATADVLFFPVDEHGVLNETVNRVLQEGATIIIAIDAALGWPVEFSRMVSKAAEGIKYDTRQFNAAIDNPYLYRQTERFIKQYVRKGKDPLTAPGDKFGNNSSKAQMLVAWLRTKFPSAYRPPFDGWSADEAFRLKHSIIEVYPDASLRSKAFEKVRWPAYEEEAKSFRNKDIDDAKLCALTAVCYAAEIYQLQHEPCFPRVYLPDDPLALPLDIDIIKEEGWIFAPYKCQER